MNLLGLISSWKGYAAVGGACLLVGAIGGYRYGDAKVDRVLNKINNHTIVQIEKAAAISSDVGTKTEAAAVKIRTVTQTIHDQVPVYVPLKSSCDMPAGFVSVFNASAQGVPLPDAPSEPHDAPSGVALTTVADAVVTNHGICLENAARLSGLQDWIRQMQSIAKTK